MHVLILIHLIADVGIDFTGDADLPLLEGEDWDEVLGKTHFLIW